MPNVSHFSERLSRNVIQVILVRHTASFSNAYKAKLAIVPIEIDHQIIMGKPCINVILYRIFCNFFHGISFRPAIRGDNTPRHYT